MECDVAEAGSFLAKLRLHVFSARVTLPTELLLPQPPGDALRRAMGPMFRDLAGHEAFQEVFETPKDAVSFHRGSHGLHPFWLQPGLAGREVGPGPYQASMVTCGRLRSELALLLGTSFLRAVMEVLGTGLPELESAEPEALRLNVDDKTQVRLVARTPLVVGHDDRPWCPGVPELGRVVRRGVERLGDLVENEGLERPRVAMPDLTEVERVSGELQGHTDRRFSFVQARYHPIEGLLGEIVVRGPSLPAVVPLLGVLARIGVGQKTSMGYGEVDVSVVE